MEHVLRRGEELRFTIVEGSVKGRRPSGAPRNSLYTSQSQKDAGINVLAGSKRLAEDREQWRTMLNVVNQRFTLMLLYIIKTSTNTITGNKLH